MIYPVDSAIQRLNNRGLIGKLCINVFRAMVKYAEIVKREFVLVAYIIVCMCNQMVTSEIRE